MTDAAPAEETVRGAGREGAFYAGLPYALLSVCTVITLVQAGRGDAVRVVPVLCLALAAAGWLIGSFALRRRRPGSHAPAAVSYAGLMLFAAALVALAPWYGIFAFVGYVHAFLYLQGGWRYVGVVATSLIMAVTYMGGLDQIAPDGWWLWAAVSLVTILLSGASFHFTETSDVQGRRQTRALAEIRTANEKLQAALEENAALHAQLLVRAHDAGIMEERQRMAHDIHDTLAQSLAGILTQLQAAEQTMDDPAALRGHMGHAVSLARDGLAEARRTVNALEPSALVGARLPDAIGDIARRWSERTRVDAVLTTTGDPRPMHPDVELTLLRAAQEALANVAKHARAGRVGLTLSYMEGLVTLDVRDDGVGFDPDRPAPAASEEGGFGLVGMRHRVQRLAGRLVIESEPGAGTAISASVPAIPAEGRR